ncbi:MAG TPA: penicillin-binding transpeptidase domain-containing protein, partial [Bacteroidales bacterium]|nr:penicillin-binding transpeptidase domain-containing protein [Bacteroidales bacterium]
VVPAQTSNIDTFGLCNLLGIDYETFRERMKAAVNYSRRAPSILLKQISDQTYARLQEKLFLYPGFFVQPRTLRKYTQPVAAHALGYVSEVDDNVIRKNPFYKTGDYIGKSGIEEAYEKELRGKRGVKIYLVDVYSRVKGSYANGAKDTIAVQGSDIISSIDLDLQKYGELLMKNKRGSVVAIEPKTGEVLALISSPNYDPGLLVGRVRSENFADLLADTVLQPLYNRALMASYPPGSTFKPIIGLIGLQEGVITPETRFACHNGYLFVKCHSHPSPLNLEGAIQTSCNAYFCQTFRKVLENPRYNSISDALGKWRGYLDEFGFGKKLGSDFVNELTGFIPSSSYFDKYYTKNGWHALTVISMGIGQGEVGTTPLQIANMTAAIANRGYYYTPHIVKAVGKDRTIDKRFTTKHQISIDSSNFEEIILGMEAAVKGGTGRSAAIKDVIVCGKTGTAQNPHGKDNSVFIAFAPKDNPQIAIAVYVENAGFGAAYAAPVAGLMIEKYIKDTISNKALEQRILELNLGGNIKESEEQ